MEEQGASNASCEGSNPSTDAKIERGNYELVYKTYKRYSVWERNSII